MTSGFIFNLSIKMTSHDRVRKDKKKVADTALVEPIETAPEQPEPAQQEVTDLVAPCALQEFANDVPSPRVTSAPVPSQSPVKFVFGTGQSYEFAWPHSRPKFVFGTGQSYDFVWFPSYLISAPSSLLPATAHDPRKPPKEDEETLKLTLRERLDKYLAGRRLVDEIQNIRKWRMHGPTDLGDYAVDQWSVIRRQVE